MIIKRVYRKVVEKEDLEKGEKKIIRHCEEGKQSLNYTWKNLKKLKLHSPALRSIGYREREQGKC